MKYSMFSTKKNRLLKLSLIFLLTPLTIWLIWQYGYNYPIAAQTCFTTAQVHSDSRCLYILQNHVFEKGSKSSPHQGYPCGSDVTAYIPSFHFTNQYILINTITLDPKDRGEICSNPTATPTPTSTPIPTNTPAATPTTGPCVPTVIGDTDCNNKADLGDFETWRREYLGIETTKKSDFDKDGKIMLSDFETWRKQFVVTP